MVTKQQALDAFINERVMGDALFAISTAECSTGRCVYDKKVNGGCAIGKFIPDALYEPNLEGKGAQTLFRDRPQIAEEFEDPRNDFWSALQGAHDGLAMFYLKATQENEPYHDPYIWDDFMRSLMAAVMELEVRA